VRTFLVTGGAGFVGSTLACRLKGRWPEARVVAMDNLRRRGSELNLDRLKNHGVEFLHGDVRSPEDFPPGRLDCLVDCAAEPSVMAGVTSSPAYVLQSNLVGTLNSLEVARQRGADVVFLSTSRVYPVRHLKALLVHEEATRLELAAEQVLPGASAHGVAEGFPLDGARTLYGATKLASELLVQEYLSTYKLRGVINRCGVITGPWQMGRVDQGVVVLWVARHVLGGRLDYVGFGGTGKQVRDILHVEDLWRLVESQVERLDEVSGRTFNVGGGREVSVSLVELTAMCRDATGRELPVGRVEETRPGDVPLYLSDSRAAREALGWRPTWSAGRIVEDVTRWVTDHRDRLGPVLAG
jgi:CDP-paratose 2-epimerase